MENLLQQNGHVMEPLVKLKRLCVVLVLSSFLGACAATSVFFPYPNQAQDYKAAIGATAPAGVPSPQDQILLELNEDRDTADAMLYMMERGRIAQLASQFESSKLDFEQVVQGFESQDLESTIEVSEVAAQGASLFTNDNAIPYKGSGYERIFVHFHQAFNYLGLGNVEGASIELRKAALEQRILLEKYEEEIAEAEEEAEEKEIDLSGLTSEFAGLNELVGDVKSSFQNAYIFYVSGAFWEAIGELNNALVDYKKAYEINPQADLIQKDIARVSRKLGTRVETADLNEASDNQGTVILLFEDSFVPAKSEIKLPVPTVTGGILSIAFPYYDSVTWPNSFNVAQVSDDTGQQFGATYPVVNVGALAVKDLKEQIPKLIVSQVARAFAKYELQRQSSDHLGLAGGLIANLYNIVSESADRRSWLTLPYSGQVLRMNLDEGARTLNLVSGPVSKSLPIEVKAGKTQFVRAVHVNQKLLTQVFTL